MVRYGVWYEGGIFLFWQYYGVNERIPNKKEFKWTMDSELSSKLAMLIDSLKTVSIQNKFISVEIDSSLIKRYKNKKIFLIYSNRFNRE